MVPNDRIEARPRGHPCEDLPGLDLGPECSADPSTSPSLVASSTTAPSALRDTFIHPDLHRADTGNHLRRLLLLADGAYHRYYRDWKLVDANRRVWLLRSAIEIAKPSQLDASRSAGAALVAYQIQLKDDTETTPDGGYSREAIRETQEIPLPAGENHAPWKSNVEMPFSDPAYWRPVLSGHAADSRRAIAPQSTSLGLMDSALLVSTCLAFGCALYDRFKHFGREDDLDEQLSVHQQLLGWLPNTDAIYPKVLRYVGSGLRARYELRGNHGDIEGALSAHNQTLDFYPPGHAGRHYSLRELGTSLDTLYRQCGDRSVLDKSVLHCQQALDLRLDPNADRCESLRDVAKGLWLHYSKTGGGERLRQAITLLHEALEIHSPRHPERHNFLNDLGLYHWAAFNKDGLIDDIEKAVTYHSATLQLRRELDHPSVFKSLSNLALALGDRYTKTVQPEDEQQAIALQREAMERCPLNFPGRETAINNLALALFRRSQGLGDIAALDESIALHREALRLRPKGHQFHVHSLGNLSSALGFKYRLCGDLESLEAAIELSRAAAELRLPGSPLRHMSVISLNNALLSRFSHFSSTKDILECVSILQEELDFCRMENPANLPRTLGSLANVLKEKYAHSKELSDLERAIDVFREWLTTSETLPVHRMMHHYDFARTLFLRFQATGLPANIDEAILHFEEAVQCSSNDGQLRPCILSALAVALGCRYDLTGSMSDCNNAMKHQREAMDHIKFIQPCRSHVLCALSRLHLLREAPYFDLAAAMRCIQEAAQVPNASAHSRLTEALDVLDIFEDMPLPNVIQISVKSSGAEIVAAYRSLVDLLPRVAYLGSVTAVSLQALKKAEPLVLSGAAYALAFGQLESALEILEEGRAVFWSQALRLRHPLADVPRGLAEELAVTARQLEGPGGTSLGPLHATSMGTEADATRLRRLGDRFEALVQDVRATPGLDRFLLPPSIELLRAAACKGPVVILLACNLSCDALVLSKASALRHIPLPFMTQAKLNQLGHLLQVTNSDRRLALDESRRGMKRVLPKSTGADHILAELWEIIMRPVIEALELKPVSVHSRPRVWLCPTGSFTRLPIHAAQSRQFCCSDFLVASYTPTVHRLMLSRRQFRPVRRDGIKVLLAAVPQPKSWHPLHFVRAELDAIVNTLPSSTTVTYATDGDSRFQSDRGATVAGVMGQVHDASIIHFACHGHQDPTQPLESGFVMDDGMLTVGRLMSLNLPNGFMAFLSACETAKGDREQPDQAIHLSAAVMFAGFKSVVGTLWSMVDAHAPFVAEKVYATLFEGDGEYLDPDIIPRALDEAVRELRSQKLHPSLWATYVHMGI